VDVIVTAGTPATRAAMRAAGTIPIVMAAVADPVGIGLVSPLALDQRARIAELAARQRLPAMYEIRNFVDAGGLVSYGPDLQDMYRRAATYVDRIFRGAKPGDLAIEQPGRFEMVINMQTATALGLTFPQSVLVRADEVIR
jgi:putative ABC transport system substrate-binding protein